MYNGKKLFRGGKRNQFSGQQNKGNSEKEVNIRRKATREKERATKHLTGGRAKRETKIEKHDGRSRGKKKLETHIHVHTTALGCEWVILCVRVTSHATLRPYPGQRPPTVHRRRGEQHASRRRCHRWRWWWWRWKFERRRTDR